MCRMSDQDCLRTNGEAYKHNITLADVNVIFLDILCEL